MWAGGKTAWHLVEEAEGRRREGCGWGPFSSSRKDLGCFSDPRPGGCWRAFLRAASGHVPSLDGKFSGETSTLFFLRRWFERSLALRQVDEPKTPGVSPGSWLISTPGMWVKRSQVVLTRPRPPGCREPPPIRLTRQSLQGTRSLWGSPCYLCVPLNDLLSLPIDSLSW